MTRNLRTLTGLTATAAAAFALAAPAASATTTPLDGVGTGYAVTQTGSCSSTATYNLAATPDGQGSIKLSAGVDSNRAGQTWSWQLLDNGKHIAGGLADTTAPTGSFTVRRQTPDQTGLDRIELRAHHAHTGQTCHATVLLPA